VRNKANRWDFGFEIADCEMRAKTASAAAAVTRAGWRAKQRQFALPAGNRAAGTQNKANLPKGT